MEQFQIQLLCRGCLGEKNLKSIENSQLQETFKLLSGQANPSPYIFCYICRALLLKCQQFRQRCLQSSKILEGSLQDQLLPLQNVSPSFTKTLPETIEYIILPTKTQYKVEQKKVNDISIEKEDRLKKLSEHDYANNIAYEDIYLESEINYLESETNHTESETNHLQSKTQLSGSETNCSDSETNCSDSETNCSDSETNCSEPEINNLESETNNLESESNNLVSETNDLESETHHLELETNNLELETYYLESEINYLDSETIIKQEQSEAEIDNTQKDVETNIQAVTILTRKRKLIEKFKQIEVVPSHNKNVIEKFKQIGKYFETKENIENFERIYNVKIVILSKEEQLNEMMERKKLCTLEFKCDLCFKSYVDEESLTKHFNRLHHPSRGEKVCNICNARFKDNRFLQRHTKIHRLKFVCVTCNRVLMHTSEAVEHFNMHNGKVFKCEHCNKAFDQHKKYSSHMKSSHPSNCIWCKLCGETYISQAGLKTHSNLLHKEIVCPWDAKCNICDTQFLNKEAYRKHSSFCNKSSKNIEAFCVHCGENFEKIIMLKDHLLKHHNSKATVKLYPCAKCDKVFSVSTRLGDHYRRVHERRFVENRPPAVCELCGKTLSNSTVLRYHMASHTGNKPHQCPHCPKTFVKMSGLKSHLIVHTKEKLYSCLLCPKTFRWRSGLRIHNLTIHEGKKNLNNRKRLAPVTYS